MLCRTSFAFATVLLVLASAGCPSASVIAGDPNDAAARQSATATSDGSPITVGVFTGAASGVVRISDTATHRELSRESVNRAMNITYTVAGELYLDNRLMAEARFTSTPAAGELSTIDFEHQGLSTINTQIRTHGTITLNYDNGDVWTGPFVYTFTWLDADTVEHYYEYRTTWVQDPSRERFESGHGTATRRSATNARRLIAP